MPNRMAPLLYVYILLLPFAAGLTGFDCGGHEINITILSLLDVGDCELAKIETSTYELMYKKFMYNFYNYQSMTRLGSSNAKSKLIASSFTAACIHISLP